MPEPIEKDPVMGPHYECAVKEAFTLLTSCADELRRHFPGDSDRTRDMYVFIHDRVMYLAKASYMRGYMDGMKEAAGLS